MSKPPLIAIVGPTASGKSTLAIELANSLRGEVISADSRQIYRGMDIGTGKITREEMRGIPHHLLSIANPATDTYTATKWQRDAEAAITDILNRGKVPIICGGSFFYIDILRGKMQPAPVPPNPIRRAQLEACTIEELWLRLRELDPRRARTIDQHNPRRLMRAIEIAEALGAVPEPAITESPFSWHILGIDVPPEILRERIAVRLQERLRAGMVNEVATLRAQGVSDARLISFGLEYRFITEHLRGDYDLEACIERLQHAISQYAKRQRTWLRRDPEITWLPFPATVDQAQAALQKSSFMLR
jgi:tRNA dimethylallyltransferase